MWSSDELRNILGARDGETVIEAAIRVQQENEELKKTLKTLKIFLPQKSDHVDA